MKPTHLDSERLKSLVINRNFAVYDNLFYRALRDIPWEQWHREKRPFFCRLEYLAYFYDWILSSKLNCIRGLERFTEKHLINGTTQTFDEAYFKHSARRLRVFRGEYAYHRRVMGAVSFLDDEPLSKGDYVIISAPFCSTGELHPQFYALLDEAGRLDVPVIVDCAYFGTCTGIGIDLSHNAIESVSFSLTKGLGLGDVRSGMRLSNIRDNGPICEQNKFDHSVLAAARIGLHMMKLFTPDHIPNRFRESQIAVCESLGIRPAKCIHLALGGEEWDHFRVDDKYNTLGIREAVRAWFDAKS